MTTRTLIWIGLACAMLGVAASDTADAQTAAPVSQTAAPVSSTDLTAQRRVRRSPTRLRVYRQFPGPNSQRVCNARYVQEYRPSGTVIVPVVNCYWSG